MNSSQGVIYKFINSFSFCVCFPPQNTVVYVPCESNISLQWLLLAPPAMCLKDSSMRPNTSSCATSACPCDHSPGLRKVKNDTGCILGISCNNCSCEE